MKVTFVPFLQSKQTKIGEVIMKGGTESKFTNKPVQSLFITTTYVRISNKLEIPGKLFHLSIPVFFVY